jgi:hypothetical protein
MALDPSNGERQVLELKEIDGAFLILDRELRFRSRTIPIFMTQSPGGVE